MNMSSFTYKEYYSDDVEFGLLTGLVIKSITGLEKDSEEVVFTTECGRQFKMYHEQDCCESVSVDDVCGDISDIIGTVIMQAEERGGEGVESDSEWGDESSTWTFYDIWTVKGSVNIKWLGSSNGYYSESVTFCEGVSKDK